MTIALYRDAVIGYIAQTFALGGFAAWAPTYLYRHLHMELKTADFWFGLVLVVTGLVATFVGGSWAIAGRAKIGPAPICACAR